MKVKLEVNQCGSPLDAPLWGDDDVMYLLPDALHARKYFLDVDLVPEETTTPR